MGFQFSCYDLHLLRILFTAKHTESKPRNKQNKVKKKPRKRDTLVKRARCFAGEFARMERQTERK